MKYSQYERRNAFSVFLPFLFFLGTYGSPFFLQAQILDTTHQLIKSYPLKTVFATTDPLHQWYIATEEGQVLKYDKAGNLLFEYNNDRLGNVGTIDATNPFTVLLYYPDLATIILLDRTLSIIKEISLFDLAVMESQAIAMANDNNIWIYDSVMAQLKKYSKDGKILFQSKNLHQVIKQSIQPTFLIERNNQLFLADTLAGIFIFDNYGQFKQQIPLDKLSQFQVINEQLVYTRANQLHYLALDLLTLKSFDFPTTSQPPIRAHILQDRLLMILEDSVLLMRF